MSTKAKKTNALPDWFTPENIETVIFAFPDVFGRLMGKRMTFDHFADHTLESGMHACSYLLSVDIQMQVVDGFKIASWDTGFGDFRIQADLGTVRKLPWHEKTAIVLGDMLRHDGRPVEESPRRVLAKQVQRLARKGQKACLGSELEFFLFDETYRTAREKRYQDLNAASQYSIDYHILQPGKDEDVIRRLRNEMSASGVLVECSKGETADGQHEVNLLYCEAMEMADKHVLFKAGAKDIASQQEKAISFMAKLSAAQAGNGFHIHTSIWDADGRRNLFCDSKSSAPSKLFRQFLGGLLIYSRELTYFFAPTVNSYKRFQPGSWAPTAIVCGQDNRTCGFRIVGHGNSLRVENRMPSADANPYLAFAATIAAGLKGVEEKLDCGRIFEGNAYADQTLPRLPFSLDEAYALLDKSKMAREAFGNDVIDYYVHTARCEVKAFAQAVTDWEKTRYFEQI
ncbi:MAG: glutamine synthetase [Candidatus Abyssobacteria bacterium SURF_17]|uniref:Glutamine synthetase n=1 Tax=Candidatus Abyssobacteria bacterium SURF_17 TaxID=2093361 RepID=A0A419F6U2_9BACT|nr:MAG: glutamine synthetase [Candidatus Abyssubacteria bacterium SURF_17]